MTIKKILKITLNAIVVIGLGVALVAASEYQKKTKIKGLKINIKDQSRFSVLSANEIKETAITNKDIVLENETIATIDLAQIQQSVMTNPWVKEADVFVDNQHILQINVSQRTPVARVFEQSGNNYYIDEEMYPLPPIIGKNSLVTSFTNIPVFNDTNRNKDLMTKIVFLSKYISNDSFWSKQITQVTYDAQYEFQFSTLAGNQNVILGDTNNINEKLNNLFTFYKQVSNKIGWEKYETIDIRFLRQVVASPSLGWIPPKNTDTAVVLPTSDTERGGEQGFDEEEKSIKVDPLSTKIENNTKVNTTPKPIIIETKEEKEEGKENAQEVKHDFPNTNTETKNNTETKDSIKHKFTGAENSN